MIRFRKVITINKDFLNGYKRSLKTTNVLYKEDGFLKDKNIEFDEDWNQSKLDMVTEYLQALLIRDGIVVAAFDKKRLIGFMSIDPTVFSSYVNVSYLSISSKYRGQGVGKKLFYISSVYALELGAKKLYISGHPNVETQSFYRQVGCVVTQHYNKKLVELEPLDIKLEYELDHTMLMFKLVELEFEKHPYVTALVITKTANSTFRYLPKDNDLFVRIVRKFIQNKIYGFFSVGTLWVKKHKAAINKKYLTFFEEIVLTDLKGWAEVDQFCYRIMNPLIELDPLYFSYLDKWSLSDSKDVRRVSLVSMIRTCRGGLKLYYNYDQMISLVERLKQDDDIHVKKAVGWVLKCAYPTYPKKVERYLKDNVGNLDRLIFRYALEHVGKEKKKELMSLER